MQYPQFVLPEAEPSTIRGPPVQPLAASAAVGGADHHHHPAAEQEANLWSQPWLEFHPGGNGAGGGNQHRNRDHYTCHLCCRRHLPSAQAVRYHVQEPIHMRNVQQLRRDRRQAAAVLERWNRIHTTAPAAPSPQRQGGSIRTTAHREVTSFLDAHGTEIRFVRRRSGGARRDTSNTATANDDDDDEDSTSGSSPPQPSLLDRVESLGLPAWRDAVQACLFRHLSLQNISDSNDDRHLHQAYVLLHKYERAERISLLELAVWKAVCIVDLPQPEASSSEAEDGAAAAASASASSAVMDYYAVSEWFRSGWKARKREHRRSRAVHIVLSRVVPFLESDSSGSSSNNNNVEGGAGPTSPGTAFVFGETARPARPQQQQQQPQGLTRGVRPHPFVPPSARRRGRPVRHPTVMETFDHNTHRRPRQLRQHHHHQWRRGENDDAEAAGLAQYYAMEDDNADEDDDDDDDEEYGGLAPWLRDMDDVAM